MSATQPRRLAEGGRIDRERTLTFTLDGQTYTGHPGDTLASAMIAAGVVRCGNSIYRDRPRGIVAAGVEEPSAYVTLAPLRDDEVSHLERSLEAIDHFTGNEQHADTSIRLGLVARRAAVAARLEELRGGRDAFVGPLGRQVDWRL